MAIERSLKSSNDQQPCVVVVLSPIAEKIDVFQFQCVASPQPPLAPYHTQRRTHAVHGLILLEQTPGVILLAGKPNAVPLTGGVQFSTPRMDCSGAEEVELKVDDEFAMGLQFAPTNGIPLVEWLTEIPIAGARAEAGRGRVEGQRHCGVAGRDLQGGLVIRRRWPRPVDSDRRVQAVHALANTGDPVLIEKPVHAGVILMFGTLLREMTDDPYYFMYFGTRPRTPSFFTIEAPTGDRSVWRVPRFDSFSKIVLASASGFVTRPTPLLDAMDSHVSTHNRLARPKATSGGLSLPPDSHGEPAGLVLRPGRRRYPPARGAATASSRTCVKRDVYEAAMRRHLHGLAAWNTPEVGMFFW
ncbi:hypothetical protein EDB83DRAFT_2526166 [Lactarius deliciosus]|nr:hypothetical protein EDB83DRAFT_2526166 [Lactarius deliciosus]